MPSNDAVVKMFAEKLMSGLDSFLDDLFSMVTDFKLDEEHKSRFYQLLKETKVAISHEVSDTDEKVQTGIGLFVPEGYHAIDPDARTKASLALRSLIDELIDPSVTCGRRVTVEFVFSETPFQVSCSLKDGQFNITKDQRVSIQFSLFKALGFDMSRVRLLSFHERYDEIKKVNRFFGKSEAKNDHQVLESMTMSYHFPTETDNGIDYGPVVGSSSFIGSIPADERDSWHKKKASELWVNWIGKSTLLIDDSILRCKIPPKHILVKHEADGKEIMTALYYFELGCDAKVFIKSKGPALVFAFFGEPKEEIKQH